MLSYADRAKSKPRNSNNSDPQTSASPSISSVSTISTAPSSVRSVSQPATAANGDIESSGTPSKQAIAQESAEPRNNNGVSQKSPQETPGSGVTLKATVSTASVPKPNVWAQRAQARASIASSPNAFPVTPQPVTTLQNKQPTLSLSNEGTSIIAPRVNDKVSLAATINEVWPEVGPSSGTDTRGSSKSRPANDKDKENISVTPKKGEKTKWIAIPAAELQEAVDKVRSARSSPSHPSHNNDNNIHFQHSSQRVRTRESTSKPVSARNSPSRIPLTLPSVISNSPHHSPHPVRNGSRPHSQFSSAQNSPRKRPGALEEFKSNGISEDPSLQAKNDSSMERGVVQNLQKATPNRSSAVLAPDADTQSASGSHLPPGPSLPTPPPLNPSTPIGHYPYGYPYSFYPPNAPYPFPYGYPPYNPPPPSIHSSALPTENQYALPMPAHQPALPFSPQQYHKQSETLTAAHSQSNLFHSHSPSQGPTSSLSSIATPASSSHAPFQHTSTTSISSSLLSSSTSPLTTPALDLFARPPPPHDSAPVSVVSDLGIHSAKGEPPEGNTAASKKLTFGTLGAVSSSPRHDATGVKNGDGGPSLPSLHVQGGHGFSTSATTVKGFTIGYDGGGATDLTVAVDEGSGSLIHRGSQSVQRLSFGSLDSPKKAGSAQDSTLAQATAELGLSSQSTSSLGLVTGPKAEDIPQTSMNTLLSLQSPPTHISSSPLEFPGETTPDSVVPHMERHPSGPGDFEVRDYGYGFGAGTYSTSYLPRHGNEYFTGPQIEGTIPPPHFQAPEFDAAFNPGYYPPPLVQPPPGAYGYGYRQPWIEGEPGRWRGDDGFVGVPEFEGGFMRERPRGGSGGRRGRGMNGRAFGRGFRGGRDRSRDFQPHFQTESHRGHNPRSHGPPPNPHAPSDPYATDFGYYGMVPVGQPAPYTPQQQHAPGPSPITHITFPLDAMRFALLGQVEYYFSDQNLARDLYLRRQMNSEGWIPIPIIASFNRIRTLTGGASQEHAESLVKDVLSLSSLVEVEHGRDEVRLTHGRWKRFVLPEVAAGTEAPVKGSFEGEGDDTEEDDVVFVLGKDGSPVKRSWNISTAASGEI